MAYDRINSSGIDNRSCDSTLHLDDSQIRQREIADGDESRDTDTAGGTGYQDRRADKGSTQAQ